MTFLLVITKALGSVPGTFIGGEQGFLKKVASKAGLEGGLGDGGEGVLGGREQVHRWIG